MRIGNRSGLMGAALVAAAVLAFPGQGHALVTFLGSSGSLSASASFSLSGSTLTAVLANTSAADVMNPSDVLTAFFFDAGNVTFTPLTARLSSGSTVYFGPDGGGNVGGEWGYGRLTHGAPRGQGISSTGLNLFGNPNFNGANLNGPLALDGLNYGILSAGDNTHSGNQKVTGGVPLILNSVTFTLTAPTGFKESDLSNVLFQYGTALSEPSYSGNPQPPLRAVPEPGTLLLVGLGLLGAGALGWTRRA